MCRDGSVILGVSENMFVRWGVIQNKLNLPWKVLCCTKLLFMVFFGWTSFFVKNKKWIREKKKEQKITRRYAGSIMKFLIYLQWASSLQENVLPSMNELESWRDSGTGTCQHLVFMGMIREEGDAFPRNKPPILLKKEKYLRM